MVGKAGGLVGQVYLGKNVVKAYQPKVYNPKTLKQRIARHQFTELVDLWKVFRAPATFGLRHLRSQVGMNPFNLFSKLNAHAVVGSAEGDVPTVTIDYASIVVSDGDLTPVEVRTPAQIGDPGHISIAWNRPEGVDETAGMKVYVVAPESGRVKAFETNVSAASDDYDVEAFVGETVYVYAVLYKEEDRPIGTTYVRRSPTVYFGKVTVTA